jgi:hypothetical protein
MSERGDGIMSRNLAYSAVLALLLVGLACLAVGCVDLQAEASTTVQAITTTLPPVTTTTLPPPDLSEDGWLMGVALGDTISSVIERLGEPTSVELPDLSEDPSTDGQSFSWTVGGGDYGFGVTSDGYDDQVVEYDAGVCESYLWVKGSAVSGDVIDGMALGKTTRSEVEDLFGSKVQPSDLGDNCLVRHHSGRYIFYFFDHNDVLSQLAQTSYDPTMVD